MIALVEDLDQQKVSKESKKPRTILRRLQQMCAKLRANHRKRRTDNLALRQLMQLDDALLKDMGLSRHELIAVRDRSATFDSLVKQTILSNRDNACSTTSLRK